MRWFCQRVYAAATLSGPANGVSTGVGSAVTRGYYRDRGGLSRARRLRSLSRYSSTTLALPQHPDSPRRLTMASRSAGYLEMPGTKDSGERFMEVTSAFE